MNSCSTSCDRIKPAALDSYLNSAKSALPITCGPWRKNDGKTGSKKRDREGAAVDDKPKETKKRPSDRPWRYDLALTTLHENDFNVKKATKDWPSLEPVAWTAEEEGTA